MESSDYMRKAYSETESVDEIRQRINALRRLVEGEGVGSSLKDDESLKKKKGCHEGVNTGSILSFTFGFILFLLIAVGCYAFRALYLAIIKRYGISQ